MFQKINLHFKNISLILEEKKLSENEFVFIWALYKGFF